MGKLVVSLDGVVIKEVQLSKDKTTLGRRPYNDIVIDNLAVSGEHAVLQILGNEVFIEDLNSTNGTYINGRAIKKQLLQHNDTVEIGKYKIKFFGEESNEFEKTMIMRHGAPVAASASPMAASPMAAPRPMSPAPQAVAAAAMTRPPEPAVPHVPPAPQFAPSMPGALPSNFGGLTAQAPAVIKVLNGAAAGREVPLTKVVTTVGKPGVQVASLTKRPGGYVFAHVEGAARPSVNGAPVGSEPVNLRSGDVIELAGTQMQFIQG